MVRMGHSSARAALIYQHALRERDVAIAGALSDAIGRVLAHESAARLEVAPTPLTFPRARAHTDGRADSQ